MFAKWFYVVVEGVVGVKLRLAVRTSQSFTAGLN